jgi:hypothetical protein
MAEIWVQKLVMDQIRLARIICEEQLLFASKHPFDGPRMDRIVRNRDAGIGGRVADSVGELLKRLARDNQVLSVTHLPQIDERRGHGSRVITHRGEWTSWTMKCTLKADCPHCTGSL